MNDGWNIKEEMTNHRDSGDFIIDILEARKEFADDPHSLGIRVLNIVSDFEGKVKDEFEDKLSQSPTLADAFAYSLRGYAEGDFRLKQQKEI
jgi:hypothetical protein